MKILKNTNNLISDNISSCIYSLGGNTRKSFTLLIYLSPINIFTYNCYAAIRAYIPRAYVFVTADPKVEEGTF